MKNLLTTVRLGPRGPNVARLCLSGASFGEYTEQEEVYKIIARYQEAGGNFIDATGTLGGERSELTVGSALRKLQGRWIIGTGTPFPARAISDVFSRKPDWLREAVERSRHRLGVDQIDIFYLRLDDQIAHFEAIVETLGELMEEGKIGGWGFSNLRAWKIAELIRIADCFEVPRPIAARPYYHAFHRQPENDYLPACAHFQVGVVAYAALARGLLSGKKVGEMQLPSHETTGVAASAVYALNAIEHYLRPSGREIAKFAVQWVLANRLVSSVLIRPRSAAQLDVYLSAANIPYTSDDEAFVNQLVPSGNIVGSLYRAFDSAGDGRVV